MSLPACCVGLITATFDCAPQGLTHVFPWMPTFGWAVKSTELTGARNVRYPRLEAAGLLLHHAWFLAAGAAVARGAYLSAPGGAPLLAAAQWAGFAAATNALTGLLLAVVFGLGHNGMAVHHADARPDFWTLQVTFHPNNKQGGGDCSREVQGIPAGQGCSWKVCGFRWRASFRRALAKDFLTAAGPRRCGAGVDDAQRGGRPGAVGPAAGGGGLDLRRSPVPGRSDAHNGLAVGRCFTQSRFSIVS